MSYREHHSPAALTPWLVCTWERTGTGGPPVRVLPDGCIDIVWTETAGVLLVGANTTAFLTPVPAASRVVGARLAPGAAPSLLGISAPRLRDQRLELGSELGEDGRRLAAALDDSPDPLLTLRSWLHMRGRRAPVPDPLVAAAVKRLAASADAVNGLALELGVSQRGLRRRVTAGVGYGPKRLGRILRLERALATARSGRELGRVAFDAGYADQAHFTNDCRELSGLAPTSLLNG